MTSTRAKARPPSVSSRELSKAGIRASQVGLSGSSTTAVGFSAAVAAGFSAALAAGFLASSPSGLPSGRFHSREMSRIILSKPLVTDPWPRCRSDLTLSLIFSVYFGTSPAKLVTWAVISQMLPPSSTPANTTTKITASNRLMPYRCKAVTSGASRKVRKTASATGMNTVRAQYRQLTMTTLTTVPVRITRASCQLGIADVLATIST